MSAELESTVPRQMRLQMGEKMRFFGAFARHPLMVGALLPSSPALAERVADHCDIRDGDLVVELGPGTGAITRFILPKLNGHNAFFALELDGSSVQAMRERFPRVSVYHDSAEKLCDYLARHGRERADCIISALPWGNMGARKRNRILDAVFSGLRPGGVFVSIGCLHASCFPGARGYVSRLRHHFSEVVASPVVWANMPPAFVYRCR